MQLPNRLNYIHWIEDLLLASGLESFASTSTSTIRGIDIGTGASCIYALLGAKTNGWSFLASEIDDVSFDSAVQNVARNSLAHQIHVQRVATSHLLLEPLRNAPAHFRNEQIHFSMCNPPFFGDAGEADTNPDSACTGSTSEMVYPGGEVAFIGHMIADSLELRDRILVYTSMIGRKSSLRKVLALLRDSGVGNVASIEFCQGRTKRWGIAWSFAATVSLRDQVGRWFLSRLYEASYLSHSSHCLAVHRQRCWGNERNRSDSNAWSSKSPSGLLTVRWHVLACAWSTRP
jgi:23S rRNA A1618 N6-methylase RlmF